MLVDVVLTVVGLGLVLAASGAAWRVRRGNRQLAEWTHVVGRLVDVRHQRTDHDGDEWWSAQVAYRTAEGQVLTGWAIDDFEPIIRRHVGEAIEVWYSPSEPTRFRASRSADPRDPAWTYALLAALGAAGLVLLAVGLLGS
ncbi:MAG TPA: DUF3592 domain-containing protein [Motilibacteraceae bacterium]|nr:DUF3592 domain-containing protein [Motilibacteraceae bacterium]